MDYIQILNREPQRCSTRNPCWCMSVVHGAKVVAGITIVMCLIHFALFAAFAAEHAKSLKNLTDYEASLGLSKATRERPIHVFRRRYIKQYKIITIVSGSLAIYSLVAGIPSILIFCTRCRVPRTCFTWIGMQVLTEVCFLVCLILFILSTSNPTMNSNSATARENERKARIPKQSLLTRTTNYGLIFALSLELVLEVWFVWVMGAYGHFLVAHEGDAEGVNEGPNMAAMYYSPTSTHPSQLKIYGTERYFLPPGVRLSPNDPLNSHDIQISYP